MTVTEFYPGDRAVWHFRHSGPPRFPRLPEGDYEITVLGDKTGLSEIISPKPLAGGLVKVRNGKDGAVYWADLSTLEKQP